MSEHVLASPEISFAPQPSSGTKRIWTVFWILSVITIVELGLGLLLYTLHLPESFRRLAIKGVIGILSLAKAYYIVGVFMHLGSELKNLRLAIVVTLGLFIWFIIAFLADGNSWKNLRNTRGGSVKPDTEQVAPAAKQQGSKE